MCNLYSQTRNIEAIRRLFRIAHNRAPEINPQPAIFPGWTAPVIRKAEDGERELLPISWGFVLLQPGKAPRRVTNVRDDKILASRFWRPSFEQRRCLVPASSYCEPDTGKPAKWHWFAVKRRARARAVRVPWHLAALERSREERRAERRGGRVQLYDDHAERIDGQHQSRAHAGAAIERRRVRDVAERNTV